MPEFSPKEYFERWHILWDRLNTTCCIEENKRDYLGTLDFYSPTTLLLLERKSPKSLIPSRRKLVGSCDYHAPHAGHAQK